MGEIYQFNLLNAAREVANNRDLSQEDFKKILNKHGVIAELMTQDEMEMFKRVIRSYGAKI